MTDPSRTEPFEPIVETGRAEAASAAGPGTPAEGSAPPDVEELRGQRDEYYDLLLRKTAEFDNYRKRTDRERREQSEYAAADLIGDLLPLLDDLERALRVDVGDGAGEVLDAYRKGVELIQRQLTDVLRKRGVTPIETVGADFDPHVHQAVVHELSERHRDNEVMAELRRGYMIGERLLRPALVKVAKAS